MNNKIESSDIYFGLLLIIDAVVDFSGCTVRKCKIRNRCSCAAGFRVRIPSTQEQIGNYNQMTPYKLEGNTFNGKALYTYADKQNEVVYIGGDKSV